VVEDEEPDMSQPGSKPGTPARALLAVLSGVLVLLMALPPASAQSAAAAASSGPAADGGIAAEAGAAPAPAPRPAPVAATPDVYADTDPGALTYFRPTLDPYGTWIDDPVYGVVWVPDPRDAGADFAPYLTSGHWALATNGDWVWVSDLPWGWVVFHYGRWVWISGTGWAWIPGRRYASAWVVWRVPEPGYDYVGWAPMPPAYVWFGGVAVVLYHRPPLPFVFCHSHYVFGHSLRRHLVPRSRLRFVASHTQRYHRPARSPLMGPPVSRTHVPASAMPRTRVMPSPRAVLAARRSTSARVTQRQPASPRPGRAVPAWPARAAPDSAAPRTAPRGSRRAAPRTAPVPSARPPSKSKPKGHPGKRAAPKRAAPKRAAPKRKAAPEAPARPHRRGR
jgi:hypothetical protein